MSLNQKINQKELAQKTKANLGEIHPQEIELIWLIRNVYKFGRIEIETRDGLPVDVVKTIERTRLGEFSKLSTG